MCSNHFYSLVCQTNAHSQKKCKNIKRNCTFREFLSNMFLRDDKNRGGHILSCLLQFLLAYPATAGISPPIVAIANKMCSSVFCVYYFLCCEKLPNNHGMLDSRALKLKTPHNELIPSNMMKEPK